jgi:KAP family P-loop domain.
VVVGTGQHTFIPARVNCSQGITFDAIWREVFKQLPITREGETYHIDELVASSPNSEEIRGLLEQLDNPSIIVIDEFDRVDATVAALMADTLKTLSDRATETTLVIAGVADSIDQLIEEHESVNRALVQVQMPRMSIEELLETIDKGLTKAAMAMPDSLKSRIASLSQGLPHYTHLLAKLAALAALKNDRLEVNQSDYDAAIGEAVADKTQTLGKSYQKATHSPKKNIFAQVLLACALAADRSGYFSAKNVRDPLRMITNQDYDIQAYTRHLNQFSQESRGPILKKEGITRRFQYKFIEPLMQPYVVMRGLADRLISEESFRLAIQR